MAVGDLIASEGGVWKLKEKREDAKRGGEERWVESALGRQDQFPVRIVGTVSRTNLGLKGVRWTERREGGGWRTGGRGADWVGRSRTGRKLGARLTGCGCTVHPFGTKP